MVDPHQWYCLHFRNGILDCMARSRYCHSSGTLPEILTLTTHSHCPTLLLHSKELVSAIRKIQAQFALESRIPRLFDGRGLPRCSFVLFKGSEQKALFQVILLAKLINEHSHLFPKGRDSQSPLSPRGHGARRKRLVVKEDHSSRHDPNKNLTKPLISGPTLTCGINKKGRQQLSVEPLAMPPTRLFPCSRRGVVAKVGMHVSNQVWLALQGCIATFTCLSRDEACLAL